MLVASRQLPSFLASSSPLLSFPLILVYVLLLFLLKLDHYFSRASFFLSSTFIFFFIFVFFILLHTRSGYAPANQRVHADETVALTYERRSQKPDGEDESNHHPQLILDSVLFFSVRYLISSSIA